MQEKLNQDLDGLLGKLEGFITTKTVIGEPIHIDNTILVPLVDVSFGLAAGSSAVQKFTERNKDKQRRVEGGTDAGAGGLGAKISPSAMLVIQNGTTQLISIKGQDSITKLIDMIPGLISKVPDFMAKFTGESCHSKDANKKDPENEYHKMEE